MFARYGCENRLIIIESENILLLKFGNKNLINSLGKVFFDQVRKKCMKNIFLYYFPRLKKIYIFKYCFTFERRFLCYSQRFGRLSEHLGGGYPWSHSFQPWLLCLLFVELHLMEIQKQPGTNLYESKTMIFITNCILA